MIRAVTQMRLAQGSRFLRDVTHDHGGERGKKTSDERAEHSADPATMATVLRVWVRPATAGAGGAASVDASTGDIPVPATSQCRGSRRP